MQKRTTEKRKIWNANKSTGVYTTSMVTNCTEQLAELYAQVTQMQDQINLLEKGVRNAKSPSILSFFILFYLMFCIIIRQLGFNTR